MNSGFGLFLKYFSRALMILLVMPIINSARGLAAKSQGDDTAEQAGRITLNPFMHLDPIGSLAILLCGFGWSKPMPFNVNRMRDRKKGIIILSLTGPLTHFLSAIACNLVMNIMLCSESIRMKLALSDITPIFCIFFILTILSAINVSLGVINLLPLPGMDGFNILYQFAPPKFLNWYHSNYRAINQASTIILLALFFMPTLTNGLFDPLGWLIGVVSDLLGGLTSWIPSTFGS
ncbi:MAG: site-2 protease family protein [Ruminococcus sp.]|nr:site-2 protease family protein [Ruminococcus sp.]